MAQSPAIRAAAVALATLLVLTGTPAGAQPLYPPFPLLSSPGTPAHMLMEDFTGDGIEDLVVASTRDGRIRVNARAANGTFVGGVVVIVGGNPSALFAGDYDRDGDPDLAWADELTGTVGVILFAPGNPPPYVVLSRPGPDEPTDVVMVDLDSDGWLDVLAAHGGADELVTYPNVTGVLGAGIAEPVGDRPDRLLYLDHAGGPTLALRQSGRQSRNIQLSNLADGTEATIDAQDVGEIFRVDVDGDGGDELLLADEAAGEMIVLRCEAGIWTENLRFGIDAGVTGIDVAQVAPGDRRLAVASAARRRVAVYSVEPGAVTRLSNWYSGGEPGELVFDDVNADDVPDVSVAQGSLDRVQILTPLGAGYFGQPAATAPLGATSIARAEVPGGMLFAVPGEIDSQIGIYRVEGAALHEPMLLDAPTGVRSARFAHLDGDGILDLACVSRTGGMQSWLADGSGGYSAAFSFVPTGSIADLALVDVIGGPALDLALASLNPAALVVYEGLGGGAFNPVPAATIATTEPLVVVRTHDLDLDGREDLVALGFDSVVTLFMNRVGQALAGANLVVQNAPRDVAFGRFNYDAYPDVVTVNEGNSEFAVLTSVLAGVYTVAVRGVPTLAGASRLEVADFDSDGVDDLCVSSSGLRSVGLHLNTGTPEEPLFRFTPPIQYEFVDSAIDVAVPDLDGDGTPDLVGLDGEADVIAIRLSNPFGVLGAPTAVILVDDSVNPRRVEVRSDADFAHDLRLVRDPGGVLLPLVKSAPGIYVAYDELPASTMATYIVSDVSGRELDRVGVSARVVSAPAAGGGPVLMPVRYEHGRAILRMRAPAGTWPDVSVYDLRGRRVATLEVAEEGSGWFGAEWSGTDLRGRPVSMGRYLVRASLGPVTGTRSIHLR